MLIGVLLPLMRRLRKGTRVALGVGAVVAGAALVLGTAMSGRGLGVSSPLIRVAVLLSLSGLVLLIHGLRRPRRAVGDETR